MGRSSGGVTRNGQEAGPHAIDRRTDNYNRKRGPPLEGATPAQACPKARQPEPNQRAGPPSMAWRVSIIFCADSSMSMTRESMRDTK